MANSTVAQSINRQTVAAALKQARIEAAEHTAWINAINRAALNLEACTWVFDGEALRIASAAGCGRYTVTSQGCECKAAQAGKPCWHRAAWRLLRKAAELMPPAAQSRGSRTPRWRRSSRSCTGNGKQPPARDFSTPGRAVPTKVRASDGKSPRASRNQTMCRRACHRSDVGDVHQLPPGGRRSHGLE